MSHEHEWLPFSTVASWSYAYEEVQMCKGCRTFRMRKQKGEGEWEVKT